MTSINMLKEKLIQPFNQDELKKVSSFLKED